MRSSSLAVFLAALCSAVPALAQGSYEKLLDKKLTAKFTGTAPWQADYDAARAAARARETVLFAYFTRSDFDCPACLLLENKVLAAPAFAPVAEDAVLFLSVKSLVKGRPHDDLAKEKGFDEIPTLAYLAPDGELIAKHQANQDPETFRRWIAAARRWLSLRAKADRSAQEERDLLLAELTLQRLDPTQARARRDALLELLPEEERKALVAAEHDYEVERVWFTVQPRTDKAQVEVGKTYWTLYQEHELSPGSDAMFGTLWTAVQRYAQATGDVAAYETAIAQVRARHGKKAERLTRQWEESLAKLKKATDKSSE